MKPDFKTALPSASAAWGKKVFVIEDHPLMRRSIVEAILREPDLTVCGQAEDAPELSAIVSAQPDLVLTDLQLKSTNGLDLIRKLRSELPDLPIVATTMFDEHRAGRLARTAGASAFVSKNDGPARMIAMIREAMNKGGEYEAGS